MHGEEPEPEARAVLTRFLGSPHDYVTPRPRAFLERPGQADKVRSALRAPEQYEIVELCTSPHRPRRPLGVDVGYWCGGNFSILCDAAIWPIWHAPTPDAFGELAGFMRSLNEHALFGNEQDARRYLDWYRAQAWAEKEPSAFEVIAVGTASP
jgi:hypothetical protein